MLDYNFPRIPIEDVKGFEVIILLFAALFRDIATKTGATEGMTANDVKRETQRLQKLENKAEEATRRQRAGEIDRETERLRKLAREEYLARKAREEEVERETERLRKLEGWYPLEKPVTPPAPKKRWWSSGGQWSTKDVNNSGYGPKYTLTGARMMGYSS
jgi:hypothetical protein